MTATRERIESRDATIRKALERLTCAVRKRMAYGAKKGALELIEAYQEAELALSNHPAAALTALCEEMEREKQRSSLDRNSSEHKNCDSTCQECT